MRVGTWDGIGGLIRRGREISLSPPCKDTARKRPVCKSGSNPHQELTLDCGLPASRTGRNKRLLFLKIFYLFIFRERGRERERGEKHQCVVTSRMPPTGNLAHYPGMCRDGESNQRPFSPVLSPLSPPPSQDTNVYCLSCPIYAI